MAEITVDVGVRLKAMQSSVADLQKVLDGLQPNSSGFKALQRIIADINRDMDRLRIQTSKPFGSQNQFNQTEKTVDKLEESLEKVKITIDRIKFSDLKLDSSQTAQLDNFKQQLKDIKQEFTNFKADLKGQFLDNDFNKAFVEGINPNLLNKSFDEIVKNVENRVNSLGSTLAKAKAELEEFKNASKLGEKIDKIPDEGLVSQEGLGENFKKFFQINSKGVFGFKTGGGLQKGEIKQQFIKYLTEEFQLTESQIKQLQDQTMAKDIRDLLSNKDFFNPQLNAATAANKKMSGAESAFTSASKNYENAAAVIARLTPLLSALSNEELSLEDKQKLVNEAIKQFEQDCVNGAKGSKTLQDSTKGLSSGLESFKQQLGQVNAQWLNLQKQQATFNSMKSAIVNFMGFNQVLNLTKKAVKEAMDHIKQLDTVMNGIAIVTDMTTADLWNQVDVYSEMAQRYGTSIQGAYEVSKIYYQAGYETNEVLTLMNETLKLSKISGLDYATTTDYMMTATRGFHMEVSEASKVVDVYSALAANTAVSQQELAEAMTRTASSMESVGTTFEEASAMIATMVATTRESANNIGSAMKSIASRYGELTKDPAKLMDAEGEAMSFNRVDTALKSVGISLQTTDHQFRSFTDVILELSEVWDTLDSVQQRYIATQFAGNRQQSRFLALVSNPDQIKENLEVAAESEDTGTLQALKALDSLETKLNQVQVAYQQFYTTIGIESVWKTFLDGTKNVIDTLNNLPKLFGKVPLGAVAVIYDIISLIKNIALKGLEEIASIWIQKTQEMTAQTQAESGKNKDNGTAWVDNFVSGISSGIDKIRQVAKEAVDAANEEAIKGQFKPIKGIDTEQFNPFSGDEGFNLDIYASGFESFYFDLQQTTNQFTTQQISSFEQMVESIRNGSLSYQDAIQQVNKVYQENIKIANDNALANQLAGDSALNGGQKFLAGAQGIAKAALSSKKLASTTSGLAMGLNTIAMLINTTSESGKRLAGTLMTVAGGLRAVGAVLQYVGSAGQMAFPWVAVITGIIGIVNGISTAYEDAQERLERLTKEAEELNNEAKKTKAEYNTLQRSVDKLEELKEKRYESAEAADEYQSAIDDLASKFPQLVAGFDEAGNIIIDTVTSEAALTEARQKTLQATLEAAKAEYERRKEETKQSQEDLNRGQSAIEDHQEFLRTHGENNTDWIREYIDLDLNSPNAGQDVQKLIDSYYNLDENLQDKYNQIVENLQDWVKASNETFNYQDLENSAKKQLLSAQALANKNYSKLGASQAIFTNYLFEQSDIIDENGIALTVFNEKEKDYYDALEQANIDLVNGGERYDKYIQMMKNINLYSITDWQTFFGDDFESNEAYLAIADYYTNVYHFANNLRNKILDNFKNDRTNRDFSVGQNFKFDTELNNGIKINLLYNAIGEQEEKISSELNNWLVTQINTIKTFGQQGYIKAGNTLSNQIASILNEDINDADLVFSILNQYDISTIEGLTKARQALQEAGVGEELFDNFDIIEKELIYNIPLAIQSYTQDLVSNVNAIGEKMKKASSGFDGNEALDVLDSLQASGYENFTLADFSMEKNGKFVIKNQEMRQAYFDSLLKEQEAISEALDKRLENLKKDNVKQELNKLIQDASESGNYIVDKESLGDYESIFRSLGWLEETTDGQLKLTETYLSQAKESGFNLLEALDKWLAGALKNSIATEKFLQKTLPAEEALSAGDYKTYLQKITGLNFNVSDNDLAYIAKNGEYKDLDYKTEIKPLKDKINSVYNNLISDALSKGLDNIRPEDYEGLIDDSFDAGEEGPHRYEEFVRRYADLAGKSVEETNSLIIQTIEKDTQTTTGAAAEAVGKIQWLSSEGKGFAALKDIQTLADALGISVDKILGEYNNQLDMYLVDISNVEGIDLSAIDGFSDTVKDSINAFLKQIFENVNKAITGKLTNADVTTLIGQLEQLGLKDITLDFTQTVDGLKLSQHSAIELYNELKKIDALQAQLVFEDLAKSLEASDTNYTNISTTLARIAELEKAIKEMKPDDARLQMYKNELAVAQEIARTRSSTDNKDFNFMDRALPTGMQNPIDYWNATGEAYKAMNASAKSGYMEIQDFYNIVQEMSNMAQVSGQTLHFMGQEIDGSAETAAALIQRGFSALTNVKGDGVKIALGNIGADFKTGATDMKGDFDSGIKEMAKAQIQMLDAAINMLEAIVAMEDIDVDQDGLFSLDELFNGGNAGDGWTKPAEAWFEKLDSLTGGIEVGGVDLKTALLNMAQNSEDGAERVKQFMNDLKNIDWTLGDVNVAEKVHQLVQGLFIGQDITQGTSIFEILDIPKNADRKTEEFSKWLEKVELNETQAGRLINHLQTGGDFDIRQKSGEKSVFYEAIEKILGLTREDQKEVLEQFSGKDNKLTQEEIKLWSNIELVEDASGEIVGGTYTASDGSTLSLDGDAAGWQDKIADYEKKISLAKNTGGEANNIDLTKTSPMKVKLTGGAEVEGAVTAIAGGVTASYRGQSQNFYGDDAYQQASNWIKEQAELEMYHVGETGGAVTKRNKITGELEVVPAFTITGTPTDPAETEKEVQNIVNLKGKELTDYIERNTNKETGKITLPNIPIEFEEGTDASYIQEIVDKYFGDGTFDTLPGKIAEGITTAFTQDTSISEAIGQGIRTALINGTGENGKPQDISLPTLNLKPESITIQAGEIIPTITGVNENSNLPIPSITIEAQNVLLTSTREPNSDGLNIPTSIPKEDLSIIYSALNLIGYKENVNESGVYLPAILEKHPVVAAYLAMLLLMSNSDTDYNETFVNNPSENLEKKFEAAAILAKLVLSSDENTDFVEGSISVGEGKQLKIKQVLEAIATGKIKINSPENGSSIEQGNIIIGEGENQLTLSQIEWITVIDAIKAELGSNYQVVKTGVTLTEDDLTLDPKELIQPISGIRYTNNFQKSREKVGLNNDWGSIDKNNKLGKDLVTSKNNDYLNYLKETAKYVGKGGILTSVDWTYLNPLKEMSDVTIPESVLTTLQSIDGLDLTNVKLENSQDLFNLLVQLQQFNESNSSSFSSITDSLNALEVGELPEISTALQDIVAQAQLLEAINWQTIIDGINGVTKANLVTKPNSNNPEETGDTSSNSTQTVVVEVDANTEKADEKVTSLNSSIEDEVKKKPVDIDDSAAQTTLSNLESAIQATVNKYADIYINYTQQYKDALADITKDVDKTVNIKTKGTVNIGPGPKAGNVALATGTGNAYSAGNTLMGELGPEMVVSHGRYFVVGQNGPEMVNLAEDAIVFNHLQTEQLLRHGKASGHAQPVTNERKATSLATGNVGPAMASASAALDALKQLRAMWQSLLNASLKDLGGLAGGSGGGGGGGGGGDDEATKGVLGNLERWYNWLRDIEATQVKINKLTKEYTLLEKQGASSNDRLKNLQDEYKQLQKNKETRESLAKEQTEYRGKLLEQVQTGKRKYGLLKAFYDGNPEDGTLTLKSDEDFQKFVKKRGTGKTLKGKGIEVRKRTFYSEKEAEKKNKEIEKYNKDNEEAIKKGEKKAKKTVKAGDVKGSKKSNFKATSGIELFEKLQKTDQYGNLVYSAKDQLKILKDLGLGKYLEKDASGNKLKTAEEKVEYFFAQMESGPQEFDALTDSINDQEQAALDDAISMQEINEQIREMFTPVTGVTDSLEKWYNQLKKIEAINNKLNVLNKNNEILQRDQIANGEKIYNNYKDQIKQLEKKKAANEALKNQQIDERTNLVNQYKDLPISYNKKTGVATFSDKKYSQKIETSYTTVKTNDKGYEVDENGNYVDKKGVLRNSKTGKKVKDKEYGQTQTKTVSETYNAKGKTLPQIIEEITAQDEKGRVAYNAEQQYQIIKALGLEKFAKYDESGNKIYDRFGDLSQEEMESIVKAAISRIQNSADSINDATDSINNLTSENLDVDLELLDIQETFRQNTIEVENLMKDAVIQEHQDAIDQKKELKDAIDKAASKTVKGLRDSLDKERQTYDSDKDDKELTNLYMQLAAARAGGSAAQIDDLLQKIQDKRQEIYFNQREQAIDEIEESANKQIEALSEQTDIMQTALDYQVKYGQILEEVNKHLREWTTDQIGAYILKQDPNYLGKTQEEKNKFWEDLKQTIQQYTAKRDDDIQTEADNKQKAATVTSMIKKLPETAGLANKKEVKAARKAYNSLTDDQKKLVKDKVLNRLTNAEAQVKTAEDKEAKRVAERNTTINGKLDKIAKKQPEVLTNTYFRNKVFDVGVDAYEKTSGTEEEKVAAANTAMKQETNNIRISALTSTGAIIQEAANMIRRKYGDDVANSLVGRYSQKARDIYFNSDGNESAIRAQIFEAFNSETEKIEKERQDKEESDKARSRVNEAWQAFMQKNKISAIKDKSILEQVRSNFINTYNQTQGSYNDRNQAAERAALDVLRLKNVKRYATGGEIDYTGLAWVDGSKTKPEHIFNDQQMEFLKSGLYNNVNLTNSLVSSLGSILDKIANNDTYNSINNSDSVIIERAEVNLKIDEVASDYDARRIGQQAMNEMVRIARKSGNQFVSRR